MNLQNESLEDPVYCLLSPRFSLQKTGHFYWYTIAYETGLIGLGLDYLVVIPNVRDTEFLRTRPTWKEIGLESEWGNDAGETNPVVLARKLGEVITGVGKNRPIIFFGFESSFSLVLALMMVSKKHKNIKVALNLLDSGFWTQLFSPKNVARKFLVNRFATIAKSQSGRFILCGNSRNNASELSNILGLQVNEFPLPTITSQTNLPPTNNQLHKVKILLFISKNEINLTNTLITLIQESNLCNELDLVIHCKDPSTFISIKTANSISSRLNLEVLEGFLEKDEYEGLIKSSQVALIPYLDSAHVGAGSGKAMDALGLGVPIIAIKGSHACVKGCSVGGCFPFSVGTPDSIMEAIQSYFSSNYYKEKSNSSVKIELQQKVNIEMGVEASLKKLFSTFYSQNSKPAPIWQYLILVGYWFLASRYQKLQSWRKFSKEMN